MPKSNTEYWEEKIARNQMRDINNIKLLQSNGWNVITVWECELKENAENRCQRLLKQLNDILNNC